jgi:hypothetical protein
MRRFVTVVSVCGYIIIDGLSGRAQQAYTRLLPALQRSMSRPRSPRVEAEFREAAQWAVANTFLPEID